MSFDITFLGSDGGPIEGHNCAILLKPSSISYQDIIQNEASQHLLCIDAGAGIGSLINIFTKDGLICNKHVNLRILTHPFRSLEQKGVTLKSEAITLAHRIFENQSHYLITHPHLDHISALVVNSAGFKTTKTVHASSYTTNAFAKYVFNGIIWPRMNDFHLVDLHSYDYNLHFRVNDSFEVSLYPLSHGDSESAAYLVTDRCGNGAKVLVFGDCESDLVSGSGNILNIWRNMASYIVDGTLKGIIIECSLCNATELSELYGHITPYYLIEELKVLRTECRNLNPQVKVPLNNLNVIVNHVKDGPTDPRRIIQDELFELNLREGLGCIFSVATDGISITL